MLDVVNMSHVTDNIIHICRRLNTGVLKSAEEMASRITNEHSDDTIVAVTEKTPSNSSRALQLKKTCQEILGWKYTNVNRKETLKSLQVCKNLSVTHNFITIISLISMMSTVHTHLLFGISRVSSLCPFDAEIKVYEAYLHKYLGTYHKMNPQSAYYKL